jgi:hypothetical protein
VKVRMMVRVEMDGDAAVHWRWPNAFVFGMLFAVRRCGIQSGEDQETFEPESAGLCHDK